MPNFVDFANNEMSRERNENKLHVPLLSWKKFWFIEIGSILLTVQFMKRLAREPIFRIRRMGMHFRMSQLNL